MSKAKSNQKMSMQIFLLAVVVITILVALVLVQQRTNLPPKAAYTPPPVNGGQSINNVSDLDKNLRDLEDENLNQLDQGVNQNASEAAGF